MHFCCSTSTRSRRAAAPLCPRSQFSQISCTHQVLHSATRATPARGPVVTSLMVHDQPKHTSQGTYNTTTSHGLSAVSLAGSISPQPYSRASFLKRKSFTATHHYSPGRGVGTPSIWDHLPYCAHSSSQVMLAEMVVSAAKSRIDYPSRP
jgi:hypothetical protein